ncbi:MAG TPA: hotdog fold domain-containing protein [Gemmatimonadales bacterium]|jgi:uncharacterized protein (TIGR00369 family)|nr:hotdog fold domain-containing protein [Gemmatimonadales bacterium]
MTVSPDGLVRWWKRLRALPGGAWLFSRGIGWLVPYSGSIHARVRELRPGYARLTLRERRGVRQHLGSVHAVALVNLGELTSGLAILSALPAGARAIVTQLSAEYFKKARGVLSAEATVGPVGAEDVFIEAEIRDSAGDVVCRVFARWRVDRTVTGDR